MRLYASAAEQRKGRARYTADVAELLGLWSAQTRGRSRSFNHAREIVGQAAICERREFRLGSRARREPRGRGSSSPVCHLGARARAGARTRGLASSPTAQTLSSFLEAPPSEPTNLRTSSRLTPSRFGNCMASMRKPTSSTSADPFGASTVWREVCRSRNSIPAAANIPFTATSDFNSEAASRVVAISRVR
jgi:hypothetical protein